MSLILVASCETKYLLLIYIFTMTVMNTDMLALKMEIDRKQIKHL